MKLSNNKGCNCRRTGCLKKYCVCFSEGLKCNEDCRCTECENFVKPRKKCFKD